MSTHGLPQVLDELTGSAVTRTYTYGLQRISEGQIVNNTWTPSFYGYDGAGSVRQLSNLPLVGSLAAIQKMGKPRSQRRCISTYMLMAIR